MFVNLTEKSEVPDLCVSCYRLLEKKRQTDYYIQSDAYEECKLMALRKEKKKMSNTLKSRLYSQHSKKSTTIYSFVLLKHISPAVLLSGFLWIKNPSEFPHNIFGNQINHKVVE